MRVVILGSDARGAVELAYREALAAHGVHTQVLDPERGLTWLRRRRVLNRLSWSAQHHLVARELQSIVERDHAPDAVVVFKGYFLARASLEAARARWPVPWVNINPDSPFDPGRSTSSPQIRDSLRFFDAYFTWSRSLVHKLEAHGARRVVYLPFAADRSVHFPSATHDAELARTLTFVGSYDEQRASVLSSLADLPLRIYGNAWDRLPPWSRLRKLVVPRAVHDAELRSVVTSSLACINILRPQNEGSHNMRTFEVPAMGGVLLTGRTAEQQAFFPEGEASLMFGDVDELRYLASQLVSGAIDPAPIRAAALARVQVHDYHARARQVLDTLVQLAGDERTDALRDTRGPWQ